MNLIWLDLTYVQFIVQVKEITLTELFIKALKHPIAAVWILLWLKKNRKSRNECKN